jgi:hypothetical protein
MNADFLTIDAQSALRRCIELFSHNTRFFIIVENKHKLLNPILSRFCEIYVPEHMEGTTIINLHKHDLKIKMKLEFHTDEKQDWIVSKLNVFHQNANTPPNIHAWNHTYFVDLACEFYENGISALDLICFIENSPWYSSNKVIEYITEFYRIKSEYRCEKLLMLYVFDMLYLRSK